MHSVTITSVAAGQRWHLFEQRTYPDWIFTSYEWGSGLLQLIVPECHFFVAWSYIHTGCPAVRELRSVAPLSRT